MLFVTAMFPEYIAELYERKQTEDMILAKCEDPEYVKPRDLEYENYLKVKEKKEKKLQINDIFPEEN